MPVDKTHISLRIGTELFENKTLVDIGRDGGWFENTMFLHVLRPYFTQIK